MREYQHSLIHIWFATSILSVVCNFVVIPLGVITKNVPALILGIIEAIPIVGGVFMLLFLGVITLAWTCFLIPILAFSFLSRTPFVGIVFSMFGIPFALLGGIFLGLVPSFAHLFDVSDLNAHSYWKKEVVCASYPFSLDFFLHADKLYESTDWCILHVCNNLMKQKPLGDFLQAWMFGDKL